MTRSTDPLITDLLTGKLPDEPCDAIELRVSAHSAKELKDNVDAASTKLGFHPAVAYLKTLDLETLLLDKSPAGEQFRRRIGLFPIRRANSHRYALEPGRLMGWALPLPGHATVILMLFDSAADPTVDNPDEPLPGNAVSALLSQVCRMDQIHRLYVAEWDRWVRSPHFGAAVRAAAQLGGVDIFEGAERIDITSTEGTMFAGMKDGHASGERNNIRKRTTRAVLTKLLADRIEWPYAKVLLFPGYDLAYDRQRGDNGKVRRTRYLQSATGQHADGWQAWAEIVADGGTFLAAGQQLAAHQVPVRGTRHVNHDGSVKSYDELTDEQLERASRTLAAHVRLLRTRKYQVNKGVPIPIRRDQDFEGFAVDHDDRGPKRYGGIHRIVDLPGHCIDLTDDQWDAWERRVHGRTPRDTRTDGPRAVRRRPPAVVRHGHRRAPRGRRSGLDAQPARCRERGQLRGVPPHPRGGPQRPRRAARVEQPGGQAPVVRPPVRPRRRVRPRRHCPGRRAHRRVRAGRRRLAAAARPGGAGAPPHRAARRAGGPHHRGRR